MAKKESENEFDKMLSALNKELKTDGFTRLGASADLTIQRIPIGIPDIDESIGGGWPKGKIIELYGEEASGKTWLLLKTYATAQKNGLKCLHFDIEQSLNIDFAKMHGVDIDNLGFFQQGAEDHAERILDKIEGACKGGGFDVIGVDSIAALVPKEELEGDIEAIKMAPLARVMSKALRRIVNAASLSGTTVIFINQTRTKIGAFSMGREVPKDTPGGKSMKFYASIRLEVSRSYAKKDEHPDLWDNGDALGHILKTKCVKNKTAPPHKKAQTILRYVPHRPLVNLLNEKIEEGVVEKNKSNHKKFKYKDVDLVLETKNDIEELILALRDNGLFFDFLVETGYLDFTRLVEDGDLLEEEAEDYTNRLKNPESK